MIIAKLISIYEIVLIVRIVLTWIPHNHYNPAIQILYKITEPVLAPVRKLIPAYYGYGFFSSSCVYRTGIFKENDVLRVRKEIVFLTRMFSSSGLRYVNKPALIALPALHDSTPVYCVK